MVSTLDVAEDELELEGEGDAEESTASMERTDVRRTVGFVLMSMGLCLLLFLVYVFGFTSLQQQRKQRQMLNVFTTPTGATIYTGQIPPNGNPVAVLRIPALDLKQVVVQGTSPADLTSGPGVVPKTAAIGTKGNAVILGRRYTSGAPFAHLDNLKVGDKIGVISGLGSFKYVVISPARLVTPGQIDPASPTKRSELTMMTSSSLTGGSMVYVKAKLLSSPAASPRAKTPPSKSELGVAGSSSAVVPTILWGLLLLVCLAGSVVAYRRAPGRAVIVYVLSTPVVLAVALVFYSQLYQLMPSTI